MILCQITYFQESKLQGATRPVILRAPAAGSFTISGPSSPERPAAGFCLPASLPARSQSPVSHPPKGLQPASACRPVCQLVHNLRSVIPRKACIRLLPAGQSAGSFTISGPSSPRKTCIRLLSDCHPARSNTDSCQLLTDKTTCMLCQKILIFLWHDICKYVDIYIKY